MRGIFLDFDGVLHPVSMIADWRELNVHGADIHHLIEKRDLFRWLPLLEAALDEHPDVVLVVHSGWRSVANNIRMREILGPALSERFIGVTSMEMKRHPGIEDLAKRSEMREYLIIDDATHEFPEDHPPLIATDPELGLTEPGVLDRISHWLNQTAPDKENFSSSLKG
jgi:hypothetical protein